MVMQKIKSGDTIVLVAGKDKGRNGKVLSVKGDRVLVEGLNLIKKHQKPNPQREVQGGIIEKEAWIHVSNVMILNQETNKHDRVGFKEVDGKKVRYFKSNGELIDQ